METAPDTIKVIERSTKGLRDCLFDEINALRNGRSNPQVSSAMAKLAVQIINTVRIEIEYQKHIVATPDNLTPLQIAPILLD